MTVSEHQLAFDLDALCRLVRDRQRIPNGPARLLRDLYERGLDDDALRSAAALVLEADWQAAQRRPDCDGDV
jgi:hypothetical protein